jgi:hypothetical protein
VTKSGLSLTVGSTYYFSVKAKNGAGLWSSVGVSNGITMVEPPDTTPPTTPVVTDDGATTTSTSQLHASWSATDAESGIAEYQYAIGTTAGGTDVLAWTTTGTEGEVTRTGLDLSQGVTYYFSVKAKNGAGLWSEVGSSDGIAVAVPEPPSDTTPPTTPTVTDDGATTTSKNRLSASWSSTDPESGIAEYQYAIGTAPFESDVVGWTSVGGDTQVTAKCPKLDLGYTYYFSVKAINGVGLVSGVGSTDGITVIYNNPRLNRALLITGSVLASYGTETPLASDAPEDTDGGPSAGELAAYCGIFAICCGSGVYVTRKVVKRRR